MSKNLKSLCYNLWLLTQINKKYLFLKNHFENRVHVETIMAFSDLSPILKERIIPG